MSDSPETHWLAPDQAPEELWGKVLTASEVELRDLHNRLATDRPFDLAALQADPGAFRWQLAYDAVHHSHGEDAADAMANLAAGMVDVWQRHTDLQALMLQCLETGASTDEILNHITRAAGLADGLFPPAPEA